MSTALRYMREHGLMRMASGVCAAERSDAVVAGMLAAHLLRLCELVEAAGPITRSALGAPDGLLDCGQGYVEVWTFSSIAGAKP